MVSSMAILIAIDLDFLFSGTVSLQARINPHYLYGVIQVL